MVRLLVPVDFSQSSINAAEYAMHLAKNYEKAELVLFHAYSPGGIGEDGSPINIQTSDKRNDIEMMLEGLQVQLFEIESVPTDIRAIQGVFLPELKSLLAEEEFDFVVLGIKGGKESEEGALGSSVTEIIHENSIPIIIVSEGMKFKPIKKLALAVDLENVEELIPSKKIIKFVAPLKPELHIVYASSDTYIELTEELRNEQNKLQGMFADLDPKFTNLHMYNFLDSINIFVHQNEIDLLLIVPKKHSFWHNLVTETHTKKLAFHGVTPLVAIHN